jgi:hypothetical protein
MSIIIGFGNWTEERTYDSPDRTAGQLWRRGFSIQWSKPIDRAILFALKFQLRINGIEIEQGFTIRENPNA